MITALLGLGGKALGALGAIPLWAYGAAALIAWGAYGNYKATNAQRDLAAQHTQILADRAAQSEAYRETERLLARRAAKASDELTQERIAAMRTAASLRERLRKQSDDAVAASSAASDAIAACRSAQGATAARVLPDDVREDYIALMEQAEQVSASLRALQKLCVPQKPPQ